MALACRVVQEYCDVTATIDHEINDSHDFKKYISFFILWVIVAFWGVPEV